VLWLDCDKEGENICFEVIALVQNALVAVSGSQFMENVFRYSFLHQFTYNPNKIALFRAKFSSLSEIDIKKAMNNLVKPNRNVSRSVDALKELDLRIGCAFTRIQFNNFHVNPSIFVTLSSISCHSFQKLFSFGPCQTPTLAFCVKRHHKIQKFKPTQYWDMNIQIELPGGRLIKLDWKRGRQTDRNTAQYFLKKLKVLHRNFNHLMKDFSGIYHCKSDCCIVRRKCEGKARRPQQPRTLSHLLHKFWIFANAFDGSRAEVVYARILKLPPFRNNIVS
jgi:DNA topoisomerase-3